jgi:hypothetical protein
MPVNEENGTFFEWARRSKKSKDSNLRGRQSFSERCVRFNLGGKQNGRIHEGIEKIP